MHGSTGYRKLDYYTVCCWLLLLQICTVARDTVNWIITLCCWPLLLEPLCTVAVGSSYYQYARYHGVVSRGTVNWIITLCAVGSSYYQYTRYYGVVARCTVNWIITLCAVGSNYYQYARTAAVITNMHGSTGYRKLDYYTVCYWLLLLVPLCTVARGRTVYVFLLSWSRGEW